MKHVETPDYDRLAENRQILREAKADRDESQKTIHILTEQREDYRKQVVFLEGRIKGLEGSASTAAGYRIALERIAALDPTLPIGSPPDEGFFIRQAIAIARKVLGRDA